jgi:pimeloyl-ACP methyl ester carboxylesterase
MEQADLLEDFLRQKGIEDYHIFVHDYGDTVAQELLARHEDRQRAGNNTLILKSVCFLNGGLFPETHRARFSQKLLLSPLGGIMATLMNKTGFKKAFNPIFGKNTPPSREEIDAFWELINYNKGKIHFLKLIRYMNDRRVHRERWVGVLQTTSVPLRVIDGPDDPVSGLHMTERYKELVLNPDVVLLPGIGHYPHTEAPEEVLKAYLAFIDKVIEQS